MAEVGAGRGGGAAGQASAHGATGRTVARLSGMHECIAARRGVRWTARGRCGAAIGKSAKDAGGGGATAREAEVRRCWPCLGLDLICANSAGLGRSAATVWQRRQDGLPPLAVPASSPATRSRSSRNSRVRTSHPAWRLIRSAANRDRRAPLPACAFALVFTAHAATRTNQCAHPRLCCRHRPWPC